MRSPGFPKENIIKRSVSYHLYHFDADPDPGIRFRNDGSGSGSGSGSVPNKFVFFLLNFFCIRFKTYSDVFVVVVILS